jgi:hypothetical protein
MYFDNTDYEQIKELLELKTPVNMISNQISVRMMLNLILLSVVAYVVAFCSSGSRTKQLTKFRLDLESSPK